MARFTDDDHFDDDDDIPNTAKSKGSFPVWAIVLLCAVPIVALVAIGGAVAMFTMRASKVEQARAQAAQDEARVAVANGPAMGLGKPAAKGKAGLKRVYTRAEFNALIGSTPDEVAASVGPPESKTTDRTRTTWHYHNKTFDPPNSDQMDSVTKVMFDGGVVVEVTYQPQ